MLSPRFSGSTASTKHAARAILFAVALLLAQWVGMLHRIDHAGGQAESQAQSRAGGGYAGHSTVSHSCVVFDGAYLADLLPTTVLHLAVAHPVHALPLATDFASWSGRFAGHFQPRAPPAA